MEFRERKKDKIVNKETVGLERKGGERCQFRTATINTMIGKGKSRTKTET